MSVFLWQNSFQQFFDQNGDPLSGGKVFFYLTGSSTKQNTYTDSTGTVPNSNPMILDAAGNLQQAVWLTGGITYRVGVTLSTEPDPPTNFIDPWPLDGVTGIGDNTSTTSEWTPSGFVPTYVSATSFTVPGDQTIVLDPQRRLRITDAGGTKYATILTSVFTTLTTVTVAVDNGGSLSSPISSIAYGITDPANPSISPDLVNRKANSVVSAATTNIWATNGKLVHITGTTGPITSLGTASYAGNERTVIVDSTPQITTSANLTIYGYPNATTFTLAAGSELLVVADTTTSFKAVLIPPTKYPTVQRLTSGSGTYNTPAGCTSLRIRMIGGGGGGGGSTSVAANNGGTGGTGGNSTIATTLLVANGGTGGAGVNLGAGGSGGSVSSTAGPIILVSVAGGGGAPVVATAAGNNGAGGMGASSPFGGAGKPGNATGTGGTDSSTNSGSGGPGGGAGASGVEGAGGGAGGYLEALITNPASSYAYAVGAAGTAGVAGTGGGAGGAGGSGVIIIEESYS